MEIAAGEYGYDLNYFREMLAAEAVDCLQADATRCAGISGFLAAHVGLRLWPRSISPLRTALHLHAACSLGNFRHLEYFHDHGRIEQLFFEAGSPVAASYRPICRGRDWDWR